PDGVTEIGIFAFTNCRVLEEATIPKSITNPYLTGQFSDCRALKTIKGYKGSAARTFSRIGGYNFIALDAVEGEEQLEVKFDPDNGDAVVSQPVYKDEILNYTPGKITKKGYTFVGWYENTDNITTEYKNNQTYTKNVTYTAKWAHFEGLGAQVKVDKTGIRFGTKLYNDGDEVIEKGTVMIPTKLIDTTTQWIITLDTENSVRSIGKVNYEVNKDENYVVYLGTLINIPESQRDTYIRTSSYVKYKDKFGNEYIVYAFNKEASINSLLECSN
ncbi:MAG: InlB B-repeat-containing protein, partial [Clostridiales bacterium]|nr:InlB B-repeat-containing protein [Clostridiales bacterium]